MGIEHTQERQRQKRKICQHCSRLHQIPACLKKNPLDSCTKKQNSNQIRNKWRERNTAEMKFLEVKYIYISGG